MGDMSGLFQQAQKMQRDLRTLKEDLRKRTVSGEAGGGMVKVFVNGQQEVLKVELDPSTVDPDDVDMLEDLILVAVKEGIKKSKDLEEEEMSRVTGGLNLPGMF